MTGRRDEPGHIPEAVAGIRSVLDYTHEAFVTIDTGGFVTDWNASAERTFGWSHDEVLGQVLADLIIPPRYRAAHLAGLRRFLHSGEAPLLDRHLELAALDRSGREFPIELTITRLDTTIGPGFCAFVHDISERRLAERLLRAQHAITGVFADAQTSDDAIHGLLAALGEAMDWQLGAWWSRAEGSEVLHCRAVWASEAAAPEFGQATLELELARGVALPGRVWSSGAPAWTADVASDPSVPRTNAATRAGLHASLCVPVIADREFYAALEFFSARVGEPDLATRDVLSTIAGQIGGFMSVLDQRSALLERLQLLAVTDELTGLANRRAWQDSLERELTRGRRHPEPLCVAMLDLDYFKNYNDSHGHQAGDRLLRELAVNWRAQLRATDILARQGGEEFSLLMSAPIQHAEMVVDRVRAATPHGQTCSAGLAAFDGAETAEELVNRADRALYEAKSRGRNRTVIAGIKRPASP